MNNPTRNFTPSEFMERLARDDFSVAPPLVLTGMVKNAEDENHLLFAFGFYCKDWIALPIEMIENIQWLASVPCKEHTHPLVNITIKEPESEEAKVFAALARSVQPSGFRSPRMGTTRRALPRIFRDPRFRSEFASNSGPDVWFPCWSRCMDDLLEFASEQPPEQFLFWVDIAYQLCGQACP